MSFAAVNLLDPRSDEPRISDVIVGLLRGPQVPFAQTPQQKWQSGTHRRSKTFARDIVVITPHPAHRRVTVTNVNRVAPAPHAFRIARTATEDQVVGREIEMLDGK